MKPLKRFVKQVIYYSGVWLMWRSSLRNGRPRIVYFHEIFEPRSDDVSWCGTRSLLMPVDLFRKILSHLSLNYRIVDLEEAVHSGSSKVAAVTFDDGYRGVYRNAFPILNEMRIPATVFLTTGYLGSSNLLWWDVLAWQLEKLMSVPRGHRVKMGRAVSGIWRCLFTKNPLTGAVIESYKWASTTERGELSEILKDLVGVPPPAGERIYLSESEVSKMHSANISFGAHSRTHPLMTWLDPKQLMDELLDSMDAVKMLTGADRCWFSYPDGMFTEREFRAVQAAGYIGAVQTFRRPEVSSRFAVPRVGLDERSTSGGNGHFSRAATTVRLAGISGTRLRSLLRSLGTLSPTSKP